MRSNVTHGHGKSYLLFLLEKMWTDLKNFWFARSAGSIYVEIGEVLEALPFSWLISAWEKICDGEKLRVENTYIWANSAGLDQITV